MPRLFVVYDTQTYRGLGDPEFDQIVSLERDRSVVGRAAYQVVEELLRHLADPHDPEFRQCLAGIRRFARHAVAYDGKNWIVQFIADGLDQAAMALFKRPLSTQEAANSYGQLIGDVIEARTHDDWEYARPRLVQVAQRVAKNRAAFVESIEAFATSFRGELESRPGGIKAIRDDEAQRKELHGFFESEAGIRAIAGVLVKQVAFQALGRTGPVQDGEVDKMVALFPVALRFSQRMIQRVLLEKYPLRDKATIAYDVRLSFLLSDDARWNGIPIRLVSGDREILNVATAAGASRLLYWRDSYLDALRTGDLSGFDGLAA